ncbi:hypothetical protein A2U04_11665 [Fusobacterium necrophorum subsp. funduliforme]|uniref:hypothetical protein n=1 Tax=Fusobacterium necrophorum TaxID=859 RepID=UPI0007879192|nr:hypothetical protein [Fusobacterium necrophorum]KYM51360.1 hypothetical protein A2U04_11665 [Fusobacterium necrophorum subsp. funduliforme]
MKLRHMVYKNVSVKCKDRFYEFRDGILEMEEEAIAKELLKNPNIEEVKEEEPAGEEPAGEDGTDVEVEKSEKHGKKGKQK